MLDEATPYVLRKYIEHVPITERILWLNSAENLDFGFACEKITNELAVDLQLVSANQGNEYMACFLPIFNRIIFKIYLW